MIINNTVVSSIDVCQIQSVYNAERDYLKSIDRVEDRMCCVRGDLAMIVADPSWSLYRVMYCPSMKDEGEFDGQYVAQQVGLSLSLAFRWWTYFKTTTRYVARHAPGLGYITEKCS